jgi:predicted nucleotidyltransferase
MTMMLSALRKVTEDLNATKRSWCLIGALAVSVYSEPRTTRDIDIAIALDDRSEQDSFVEVLIAAGYRSHQVLMHVEPVQRLGHRIVLEGSHGMTVAIDLLFSSSGIETEVVREAVTIEILPDLEVPVASRPHLLAMKVLSRNDSDRVRDDLDLQGLLAEASPVDIEAAKTALKMITSRGYNRGKDLEAEFELVLARYSR